MSAPGDRRAGNLMSGTVARDRWCRRIEDGYVIVLLCALTQGPILSLWFHQTGFDLQAPHTVIRITYLAVQLPGLVLLGRRWELNRIPAPTVFAFVGFAAWMALTTVWSAARIYTFDEACALVVTTGIGFYLATSYRPERLAALVLVAMQPGLLMSEWAARRAWPAALDYNIDEAWWAGIYLNKNSLAPPAAMGVMAGAFLLYGVVRGHAEGRSRLLMAMLAAVVVYDLRILLLTRSKVSLVTLVSAVLVVIVILVLFHSLQRWSDGRLVLLSRWSFVAFAAVLGLCLAADEQVSSLFGRAAGFTGRHLYWEVTWEAFIERPAGGWGWLAVWHTDAFRARLPLELMEDTWSHNAYLDVATGGGIVAVVLLLAGLWMGWSALIRATLADGGSGGWPLLPTVFVLVAATQESFLIGNHFLYALLVAGLCSQPLGPAATSSDWERLDELDDVKR